MKGYRNFIIVFAVVLVLYIVTEVNRPKPVNWTVTLSKNDKIPYGGFIMYQQLKDLFRNATVQSFREPLYEQINNFDESNTAYIVLTPTFNPSNADVLEMKNYVSKGNYFFASANAFSKSFLDSFNVATGTRYSINVKDTTSINFVNPSVRSATNYTFQTGTIDQYFSKIDTAKVVLLGINNHREPNFIKIPYGEGAFFLHANALCFSNYFLLFKNNASYTAKALSYIPAEVTSIYWDEYSKLGRAGAATPLRFLLSNEYLRWALRLGIIGLVLYVLFQMKRRQRVIPVIEPLQNSTLDFIKTVAGVYFNTKDNTGIADKKVSYFLEFVRQRFNLPTQQLDDNFIEQLSRKSSVEKEYVAELVTMLAGLQGQRVSDNLLVLLNNKIDHFYKQV
ncbi:MAG: hypothetical protein JWQ40_1065 [Segetibacter sp.]|nr:hypothetical protein [Segetibacter sp.]